MYPPLSFSLPTFLLSTPILRPIKNPVLLVFQKLLPLLRCSGVGQGGGTAQLLVHVAHQGISSNQGQLSYHKKNSEENEFFYLFYRNIAGPAR